MARPRKEGLQYFSLDTTFEEKFESLIAALGNDALAFQIRWWQTAYDTGSGNVDLSDTMSRARLAERVRVKEKRLMEIADAAAALGLVDKDRWQNDRVLTSNGVMKRLTKIQADRFRDRNRNPSGKPPENGDSPGSSPVGFPAENVRGNGGKGKGKGNSLLKRERAREDEDSQARPRAALGPPSPARPERQIRRRGDGAGAGLARVGEVLKGIVK